MSRGITIEEAYEILNIVGSDMDPIYRRGKETTIKALAKSIGNEPAKQIWIVYHGDNARKKRGTVYALVLERIRTY